MGDKNNFYVMDDDYIEQKYVRAEEERQRMEDQQRRQREIDEAKAFEEAERQRKAADAERRRRQEEQDRANQLEEAKKRREQQDQFRKEKEKGYQERLEQIEKELKEIEAKKAGFINDKIDLAKEHGRQEDKLKADLEDILEEKRMILDREQQARYALQSFQAKARGQTAALDQDEESTQAKQKALTQERREVQNEMLKFLQNPSAFAPPEETHSTASVAPYQPEQPRLHNVAPTGLFNYGPISQPNPTQMPMMAPSAPPMYVMPPQPTPMPNYNFNYTPTPVSTPNYPTFNAGNNNTKPQNIPVKNNPPANNKSQSGLDEQLEMLDDLLKQGIMTKEEYEANKKEALRAAGIDIAASAPSNTTTISPKQAEVNRQIAQLDEYLRSGVLQQEDYDDAKQRVLTDAGLQSPTAGAGASNIPLAEIPATGKTLVSVVVPQGKRPGDKMVIRHQGREFQVIVPNGVGPGMQFHASVPV